MPCLLHNRRIKTLFTIYRHVNTDKFGKYRQVLDVDFFCNKMDSDFVLYQCQDYLTQAAEQVTFIFM